jgi:putative N6-adenine-specific DNA methylase
MATPEYTMCAPCVFGVEGIAADELRRMDMQNVRAENGRVLFDGCAPDLARANIRLATAERVLIVVGVTRADSFDALFEGVRAMAWERYITRDGAFPVSGHSLNSVLRSIPDCQRIIKKAVARKLTAKYGMETHPETGAQYKIRFAIMDDVATLYLDATGEGLHKRGYRPEVGAAPLRETLAAAIVRIARYRGREVFRDPFCGSGTIVIEAALAAKNRAPGIARRFAAEEWKNIDGGIWRQARDEALSREYDGRYDIGGGDIDPTCVSAARENARRAGVADIVRFETADARTFTCRKGGVIAANPPYGERVMEHGAAAKLYREFGAAARALTDCKLYILSSHAEFEREFGQKAVKKRKLYNGMIKCDLYMYGSPVKRPASH